MTKIMVINGIIIIQYEWQNGRETQFYILKCNASSNDHDEWNYITVTS